MGNCTSTSNIDNPSKPNSFDSTSTGTNTPASVRKRGGKKTGGNVLGGNRPELSAGEMAARAAESRIANNADTSHRTKQELLGKLDNYYRSRGETVPMGVATMNVEQLTNLWKKVKQA